jgi:hypothetical protein
MSYAKNNFKGFASPLKYISGYELDLDNDGTLDIATLIETNKGIELIVILQKKSKNITYRLYEGNYSPILSYKFKNTVLETAAGPGKRKPIKHKIHGVYLALSFPESSSIAFFWDKDHFQEISISD